MSHKQLYRKTIHLNSDTIAEMGIVPDYGFSNNLHSFNRTLKLRAINSNNYFDPSDYVSPLGIIPEGAENISMTATSKYFFLYGSEKPSHLTVDFEPYISTIEMPPAAGFFPAIRVLNIFIKGPSKEEIPDDDKLFCVSRHYAQRLGDDPLTPRMVPFNIERLLDIDLVIDYTLPD